MGDDRWVRAFVLLLVSSAGHLSAQEPVPWRDPSPHTVQFVTVDTNVKLEVLDWGGTGRPIVLLAGLGSSAHVFDDFAPKLTHDYHVYGITRRGFGASSAPAPDKTNYSADRLGDDVLAVLHALKLNRPILAGHSVGGEEMSSIATRHPERVAGLSYLDAAYSYAYYDAAQGDVNLDLQELKQKLDEWRLDKGFREQSQLLQELLQKSLPAFERDLQEGEQSLQTTRRPLPQPPVPSAADKETFETFYAWGVKVNGASSPEAQLRQYYESTPEGNVGKPRTSPAITQAIIAEEQKYTDLHMPILAIFALPHDLGLWAHSDPAALADYEARDIAEMEPQIKAFEKGVPSAHVVVIPHANHAVFITNETEVLREMRAFLKGLP